MRAVVVPRHGGPEVLEVTTLPRRHPGPGQVRIKVAAATVNPTDVASRSYPRPGQSLSEGHPLILGMEAAGVVDEVGEGVTRLAVGDEVIAIALPSSEHGGAYREDLIVDADQAVAAPKNVDLVHAATIPMNGLTALLALDMLDLAAGQDLVVSGAAGALGGYVCQIAAHRGLRVVAIGADSDRDLLTTLGAAQVVTRGAGVAERVRQVLPEGAHGAVDAALLHEELLPAVRDGGGFAVVRGWDGEGGRGITVHKVMVPDYSHRTDKLTELVELVEAGVLTTRVAQTYPITEAAAAHRRLEAGGVRGRLVLTF